MTSTYSLEQPYALFTLPRPIDSAAGHITGGSSYSINGSRKRKRTEVVIAVDGESLNVYDVKTPRLVTSHALPPQAYLTASPISVHCKATSSQPAYRYTYAAVRNDLVTATSQILQFQEELNSGLSMGDKTAAKTSENIGSREDPVVFLDFISSEAEGGRPDLLVVQARGQITCFSDGLHETVWSADIPEAQASRTQYVEYASIQDASSVKQGLFRDRPDLLAMLTPTDAPSSANSDLTNVLILVTRTEGPANSAVADHTVHLLCIRPRLAGSSRRNLVQPIVSWKLPSNSDVLSSGAAPQYSFVKKSGFLQQLYGGSLHTYDLRGSVPLLLSSIEQPDEVITSFVPISSAVAVTSSKTHCGVWDVRYRSLQALQTATVQHEPTSRLKRKQSLTDTIDDPLIFLDFFSSLDMVIASAGTQLVGLQVRSSTQLKRRKMDKARLADCLGKSMATPLKSASNNMAKSVQFTKWETHIADMDSAAARSNGKEFDAAFVNAMGAKSREGTHKTEPLQMGSGFNLFELHQAILYTLGKLYAWTSSTSTKPQARQSSIKMMFRPKRTLAWLATEGHLSPSNVENALRKRRSLINSQSTVSSKDMIVAFANFDSTLELLCKFMDTSRLDLAGATEVVKILIQSFDTPPRLSDERLLTNGTNAATDATETEVQAEEEAAEKDLTFAASLLNDEPDIRGNALQRALEHLALCFPPSELLQSLRSQLSRRDITLLIELLRVALSEGGWTSRYLDVYPRDIDDQTANQNEALSSICTLLNCALDALGTGGWIGGSTNEVDDDTSTLLSQLRVETSLVLEGVQESTFFAGFLKDFVRYENLAKETSAISSKKPRDSKVMALTQQESGSVLPLGVRAAEKISTIRVGAGGEVKKRSQRDIGQSISERIGKYTFETIKV